MNSKQKLVFTVLTSGLALVLMLTLVSNEGYGAKVVLVGTVSVVLCSAALFLWVRANGDEIELLLSDKPDWLAWGKHKHGFWVVWFNLLAWLGMLFEDYVQLGYLTAGRLIGLGIAVVILVFFVRNCREPVFNDKQSPPSPPRNS